MIHPKKHIIYSGNEAVARIAYKTNEVCAIYPITPSSEMSELVEEWSAKGKENTFGSVPSVFEMQSEAGVAGAMHGALLTGSLTTTFTASQGLLLMIPNMYKIAGELTPNVIHVATRSVATHALSIFGDHSDIMAARSSGYAFLGSASVQEAQDFALIVQAATLESRIPFVHFFDGFRTSHETSKIELVSDATINKMMDMDVIAEHHNNALNPNNPVLRGTSQGPDVFFQSREALNSHYEACPEIVQKQMDAFAQLTGRQYRLFDYEGHEQAEYVIVAMASATETIENTVKYLNTQGERVGLVKVRLFRPFSTAHLLRALPKTIKAIAVLDRTKEPGATGEPLYQDIVTSLASAQDTFEKLPKIVGGRYGLSSKEFHPGMVKAIFKNLQLEHPKNNFTIGIQDDVTHLSLPYTNDLQVQDHSLQVVFYETKSDTAISSFKGLLKTLGNEHFVQGYSEIDYKKSESRYVSHLRMGEHQIEAPYLIANANVVVCDSVDFLQNDSVLERIKIGGTVLISTNLSEHTFWNGIPSTNQKAIQEKDIRLLRVHTDALSNKYEYGHETISGLHACALALMEMTGVGEELCRLKEWIVEVDTTVIATTAELPIAEDVGFAQTLLGSLLAGKGNELAVSAFPVDGTYATDTSKFHVRNTGNLFPEWDADACTQCGACSMACPQAALRIKVYEDAHLQDAPEEFKAIPSIEEDWKADGLKYTLQVNPDQCTNCNNCVDACEVRALVMKNTFGQKETERKNWKHFQDIPEFDRNKIDTTNVSQQQLQEPLFKYSVGVDGCGEAPYLKLVSQLFGDRMLVANATGASSIFGGALPSTPWAKNSEGRGPAWANSLFEDNAEFGLGYRLSLDQKEAQAKKLLQKLSAVLDTDLVHDILTAKQHTAQQIDAQRKSVALLKTHLTQLDTMDAKHLLILADCLVKQSIWIVGGDGWAYDIGYGGLDHVIASGENVNILVLDNEVYSNTGGQMSKATPFGATAKFAHNGKQKQKKDLGQLAMGYDGVYVASVAMGADQEQTLKAFQEAESFDGPSLIIAYCHSPAHGIDMKNPSQYHKAAVASGQWPLYRLDPRRMEMGLPAFQLDSQEPSMKIARYYAMEERFSKVCAHQPELLNQMQTVINTRYQRLVSRAKKSNEHEYEPLNL